MVAVVAPVTVVAPPLSRLIIIAAHVGGLVLAFLCLLKYLLHIFLFRGRGCALTGRSRSDTSPRLFDATRRWGDLGKLEAGVRLGGWKARTDERTGCLPWRCVGVVGQEQIVFVLRHVRLGFVFAQTMAANRVLVGAFVWVLGRLHTQAGGDRGVNVTFGGGQQQDFMLCFAARARACVCVRVCARVCVCVCV